MARRIHSSFRNEDSDFHGYHYQQTKKAVQSSRVEPVPDGRGRGRGRGEKTEELPWIWIEGALGRPSSLQRGGGRVPSAEPKRAF